MKLREIELIQSELSEVERRGRQTDRQTNGDTTDKQVGRQPQLQPQHNQRGGIEY